MIVKPQKRQNQMPADLKKLIDAARLREFPASEREEQRRSFAYGNTKIENPRITRETVDRQAEILIAQNTVGR
jgi:hypothetical protein